MARDNNAGALRFIAAFLVLWGHSFSLAAGGGVDPLSAALMQYTPFHKGLPGIGVMLFFCLSGYLITKSYLNGRGLVVFLTSRVFRIFPALIVCVLLCTFVVGVIFTTLPVEEYLKHPGTLKFLWFNSTLVSGIHFKLPGVFNEMPWAGGVNGSLWTLPIELDFYLFVAVIGMLGILSCKKKFNLFAVMLVLCFTASPDSFPLLENSKIAYLGLSFLVGALIYLNIDAVICHVRPIMLALTLLCIFFFGDAVYNFLSLILFAVFTVWLSFHATVKLPRLDKYGDFSYGLYLYAFPAQQICISVLGPENPYLIVASSFSASILLAALSWFLVERPSIKLKNKLLSFIARKYK